MSNPYSSPSFSPGGMPPSPSANGQVTAPAICLIVVAGLGLVGTVVGIISNLFLFLSGALDQLEELNDGPISEKTQAVVRLVWELILLPVAGYILYGAIQMMQLRRYASARSAAIVAMVPCISPCCILGIPFGIWALIVLNKPEVKNAFDD